MTATTRSDAAPLTGWRSPTAWLPVAREVRHYECGPVEADETGAPTTCRHRSARAACRCRAGGKYLYGRLMDGRLIRVTVKHSRASNGEEAWLPYPTRQQDYEAVMS